MSLIKKIQRLNYMRSGAVITQTVNKIIEKEVYHKKDV
jgi:ribosomal protein S16